MEVNPIKIGKKSTWTSNRARRIWLCFHLSLMIGIPILDWFFGNDFYPKTFHNLVQSTPFVGFEVGMTFLLVVFGILPGVETNRVQNRNRRQ